MAQPVTDQQMIEYLEWAVEDARYAADKAKSPFQRGCELDRLAMYEALLARLSGDEPPSGWQAIATAPKDGDYVLVLSASLGHVIAGYELAPPECGHLSNWVAAWDGERLASEPTHWMPLPSAPVAKDSAARSLELHPNVRGVENINERHELAGDEPPRDETTP